MQFGGCKGTSPGFPHQSQGGLNMIPGDSCAGSAVCSASGHFTRQPWKAKPERATAITFLVGKMDTFPAYVTAASCPQQQPLHACV